MAGTVVAKGKGVNTVRIGQRLVVANSAPCGHCHACRRQRENLCQDLHYLNGAFAEYILVPARFVSRSLYGIDDALASERAALSEPLACVLHGIDACREALTQPARVVVIGGGPIGLLFVACLTREGHRVALADPNASRLSVATAMGADMSISVHRDVSALDEIREVVDEGIDVAIDCTGTATAWSVAIDLVQNGGLVNLFGGCAPGTEVKLDTHRLHYSELTVKGVYHHRPNTFRRALAMLNDANFPAHLLLNAHYGIDGVEAALQAMAEKQILKAVVSTR